MNALTRNLVTRIPLSSPTPALTTSARPIAGSTAPSLPFIVSAATRVLRLITYATERSSEPPRMTRVWPTATSPRPAATCSRLTVVDWLKS